MSRSKIFCIRTRLRFGSDANAAAASTRQQVGDGVKIGTIDTDFTQGGLQTTGINTNLAINGNGFFTLNNIDGSGSATYTRDGDFSLNENGYLYDPTSGKAVLGYPVQSNGTISQVAPPQPIQIPFGLKSIAVGTGFGAKSGPSTDKVFDVSLGGNLNQTDYITAVSSGSTSVALTTITTTIYDSLGGSHEVQITYAPDVPVVDGGTGASLATRRSSRQRRCRHGCDGMDATP